MRNRWLISAAKVINLSGADGQYYAEYSYGTEMYQPSMVMRSAQYIWEKNVIRIWNDKVLEVVTPVNDENLKEGLIARKEK